MNPIVKLRQRMDSIVKLRRRVDSVVNETVVRKSRHLSLLHNCFPGGNDIVARNGIVGA